MSREVRVAAQCLLPPWIFRLEKLIWAWMLGNDYQSSLVTSIRIVIIWQIWQLNNPTVLMTHTHTHNEWKCVRTKWKEIERLHCQINVFVFKRSFFSLVVYRHLWLYQRKFCLKRLYLVKIQRQTRRSACTNNGEIKNTCTFLEIKQTLKCGYVRIIDVIRAIRTE